VAADAGLAIWEEVADTADLQAATAAIETIICRALNADACCVLLWRQTADGGGDAVELWSEARRGAAFLLSQLRLGLPAAETRFPGQAGATGNSPADRRGPQAIRTP